MLKEQGIELLQETLEKGNDLRFRALGSSMFPSIKSGDVITVMPVESAAICVGDVIFYRRDGRVYAHRLIRERRMDGGFLFTTRGDCLPFSDPPINPTQVFGKVVSIERGRRIIRLDTPFQQRWGRVLALTSPRFYPLLSVAGGAFHILRRFISKINLKLNDIGLLRQLKRKLFPKITYRIVSSADLPALARFYNTGGEQIAQATGKGWLYCLAEHKGKIVAAVAASRAWEEIAPDNSWWIMGLYVVPRYQGGGIGEGLVAKAISALKEQGIDVVFLNLFENNIPAIKLYQKLGFKRVDVPEMEKKINEHYARVAPDSAQSLVLCRKI